MPKLSEKKKNIAVKMKKGEFVKEHRRLLGVLKSGRGREEEYEKQKKELKERK